MQLGPYSLGDPIAAHPKARKFGWWDNRLERRKTRGETLYKTPECVEFVNSFWYLVLGAFQDHIYRLSARFSTENKDEMESVVCRCGDFCTSCFGTEMRGDKKDAAIWDAPFGKVPPHLHTLTYTGNQTIFATSF